MPHRKFMLQLSALLAAAIVSTVVGSVFGASSRSARSASQDPLLSDAQFDDFADRAQSHGVVAQRPRAQSQLRQVRS